MNAVSFLVRAHDGEPVLHHASEPDQKAFALGGLAAQQRDLFGIFPDAHQVEAKIRFVLLLPEIDADQRPADQVGQDGAEHRIDQRAPDEIAGNCIILTEQVQRRGVGKAPQDADKGRQRDDRAQQADADVERAIDEQLDVVGHALVGVVGGVALKLHPVMVGLMQPFTEIVRGHPAPPADLQPLIEIELVDREHDEDRGQDAEIDDLGDEVVPVSLLQRVVEAGCSTV